MNDVNIGQGVLVDKDLLIAQAMKRIAELESNEKVLKDTINKLIPKNKLTDEELMDFIVLGGFYDCVIDWLSIPSREDEANLKADLIRLCRRVRNEL